MLTRRSFTKALSALIPVSLLGSRLKGETGVAPEVKPLARTKITVPDSSTVCLRKSGCPESQIVGVTGSGYIDTTGYDVVPAPGHAFRYRKVTAHVGEPVMYWGKNRYDGDWVAISKEQWERS